MAWARLLKAGLVTVLMRFAMPAPTEDEARAVVALDAARAVLMLSGLLPAQAWRDHLVVVDWRRELRPPGMVAEAEMDGAEVWEMALLAARRSLGLSESAPLCIELVELPGQPGPSEQHGPSRFTWRRHWQWRLADMVEALVLDRGSHTGLP